MSVLEEQQKVNEYTQVVQNALDKLPHPPTYGPVVLGDSIKAIWAKQVEFEKTYPVYPTYQAPPGWAAEGVAFNGPAVVDDVRSREISSRMNALGSDGKQVAANLRKQEITGYIGSPSGCAIAQWLKKNFEGYGAVSVGPQSVHLLGNDGVHLTVPTPPAVRDFIRMFDGGAFPELLPAHAYPVPSFLKEMVKASVPATVPSKAPQFVPHL